MGLFSKIARPGSAKDTSSKSPKDQAKSEEREHEPPKPTTSQLPASSIDSASSISNASINEVQVSKVASLPKIKGPRSVSSKSNSSLADKHEKYIPPAHIIKHGHVDKTHSRFNTYNIKAKEINKLLKQNTQELMSSLTPEVRGAFENLYDRIDISDSGGITPQEIQNLVSKYTKKSMSVEEIKWILKDLDMKGTGDIEFDEFIYMLSQPENYVRLLDADDLKKIQNDIHDNVLKQRLRELADKQKHITNTPTATFFKALRLATQQDSMTILRSFYTNRLKKLNDHVIHDWSAGQRCIGLSDQEMVKRYETIQAELLRQKVNFCKDNSYRNSPYAKPLEWGLLTLREGIEQRRKAKLQELKKTKLNERRAKISFVCTPKAVPLPKYTIAKRHPLKKTFDYDQLAGIREKVEVIAGTYYNDLKDVARENSKIVRKELAVGEIKNTNSRQNFHWTFKAYCAPFVVSPWIPMPRPTLQASFTPLGRSKLANQRTW